MSWTVGAPKIALMRFAPGLLILLAEGDTVDTICVAKSLRRQRGAMRRSLRQVLIVIATTVLTLLLTSKVTAAQGGTIRGRIADSTGVPIAQAIVVLDPGGLRATSRENGDYVISRVPSGSYTVRVRRLGYVAPPSPSRKGRRSGRISSSITPRYH